MFIAVTALSVVALTAGPTSEETAWLKQHAIPLKTVEAGNGFDDLQPLKAIIGDARIVALGEPTHGTREAFQFKHRMVEFLASEMGFTIFSIEASTPESYAINPWVLGEDNTSDPAKLVGGMYFWTWNTEEVLAMVKWMREFNAREKAAGSGKKIEFTGFDMQTPTVAMKIARDFVEKNDPESLALVRECYEKASKYTFGAGKGARGKRGAGEFGVATGSFPIDAAKGKKLVYSGFIRTKDVKDGFAGLWWRCDGKDGKPGAFDNMGTRGPKGTTEWTRYEIALDIPADTVNINFGMIMPGTGEAWFDDLKIELDGVEYKDPKTLCLDFEDEAVMSFMTPARTYKVSHSPDNPHGGRLALKIESLPDGAADVKGDATDEVDGKEATRLAKKVLDEMKERRAILVAKGGEKEADWAIQNARIVWQGYRMFSKGMSAAGSMSRDTSMADNVEWILDHNPGARIVLWAHNGHMNRLEGAMGGFLTEKYPDKQMVVFGFATGSGTYTASAGGAGLKSDLLLETPPEQSVEAVLGSAAGDGKLSNYLVDVRAAAASDPATAWAREPRPMRMIGALEQKGQFAPVNAADLFDVLVYLDKTTAAVQLGGKTKRAN